MLAMPKAILCVDNSMCVCVCVCVCVYVSFGRTKCSIATTVSVCVIFGNTCGGKQNAGEV